MGWVWLGDVAERWRQRAKLPVPGMTMAVVTLYDAMHVVFISRCKQGSGAAAAGCREDGRTDITRTGRGAGGQGQCE